MITCVRPHPHWIERNVSVHHHPFTKPGITVMDYLFDRHDASHLPLVLPPSFLSSSNCSTRPNHRRHTLCKRGHPISRKAFLPPYLPPANLSAVAGSRATSTDSEHLRRIWSDTLGKPSRPRLSDGKMIRPLGMFHLIGGRILRPTMHIQIALMKRRGLFFRT
jgi:hypothetical protein